MISILYSHLLHYVISLFPFVTFYYYFLLLHVSWFIRFRFVLPPTFLPHSFAFFTGVIFTVVRSLPTFTIPVRSFLCCVLYVSVYVRLFSFTFRLRCSLRFVYFLRSFSFTFSFALTFRLPFLLLHRFTATTFFVRFAFCVLRFYTTTFAFAVRLRCVFGFGFALWTGFVCAFAFLFCRFVFAIRILRFVRSLPLRPFPCVARSYVRCFPAAPLFHSFTFVRYRSCYHQYVSPPPACRSFVRSTFFTPFCTAGSLLSLRTFVPALVHRSYRLRFVVRYLPFVLPAPRLFGTPCALHVPFIPLRCVFRLIFCLPTVTPTLPHHVSFTFVAFTVSFCSVRFNTHTHLNVPPRLLTAVSFPRFVPVCGSFYRVLPFCRLLVILVDFLSFRATHLRSFTPGRTYRAPCLRSPYHYCVVPFLPHRFSFRVSLR